MLRIGAPPPAVLCGRGGPPDSTVGPPLETFCLFGPAHPARWAEVARKASKAQFCIWL